MLGILAAIAPSPPVVTLMKSWFHFRNTYFSRYIPSVQHMKLPHFTYRASKAHFDQVLSPTPKMQNYCLEPQLRAWPPAFLQKQAQEPLQENQPTLSSALSPQDITGSYFTMAVFWFTVTKACMRIKAKAANKQAKRKRMHFTGLQPTKEKKCK